MSGQELYEMWTREMLKLGVLTDSWDELEDSCKSAWDAVAAQVVRPS